jgi:acyl carrier protein
MSALAGGLHVSLRHLLMQIAVRLPLGWSTAHAKVRTKFNPPRRGFFAVSGPRFVHRQLLRNYQSPRSFRHTEAGFSFVQKELPPHGPVVDTPFRMSTAPTTTTSCSNASVCNPEEKLRRLPPGALENFRKFRATGDEAALTALIFAVLYDFLPQKAKGSTMSWPDSARLIEDLGFDSLAIAETVFFFEDLFRISISNEEILQVRTVGELRAFVQKKLAAAPA